MVNTQEAIRIYKLLADNHIPIWLSGGWGIDALLEEHTRPHKDLDVIMLLDDMVPVCQVLAPQGYTEKILWPENRWTIDSHGQKTATAFYLKAPDGREFDTHAIRLDHHGNGLPAWDEAGDFIFTKADLSGMGTIAGYPVQCLTPQSQMICHTGYQLPKNHLRDLQHLHQKFGIPIPKPYTPPQEPGS